MKYIHFFGLIVLVSFGCNHSKNMLSITSFPLEELNLKVYENSNCSKVSEQHFQFRIKHENNKVDLNRFRFVILLNGRAIYNGEYFKSVDTNVSFCFDNNLKEIYTLSFLAVDSVNRICFIWSKKQSFYLAKYKGADILLQSDSYDNGYKIRFDGSFWYE